MSLDFNRETKRDPLQSFLDQIEKSGLGRPDIKGSGEIERFPTPDCKGQDKAGWAVLYLDRDFSAGAWGSWRNGGNHSWASSHAPEAILKMQEGQAKAETARIAGYEEARLKAQKIWDQLSEAKPDHPYLLSKGVKPFGIRQRGNNLVIPMNGIDGMLYSFQDINPDGIKKNFPGGEAKGHFHIIQGNKDPTYLVEGYATGATVHEATGSQVVVTFSCGNLVEVAKLFPGTTIAADNDWETKGNPGVASAKKTGLPFVYPEGVIDFNDLQAEKGLDAVRQTLQPSNNKFEQRIIRSESLFSAFQSSLNLSFRIKNILPESSGLILLYGAPGSYKSFIALDMALSIATGHDWHGNRVKPCPVIYLAAEGQAGVLKRIEVWRQYHKVDISGFSLLPVPCLVDNPSELIQLIKVIPKNSVVFLDTLARSMLGDENSTLDMGRVVIACDRIRQDTGSQVSIVHHSGKDESKGARGAIALTGATDTAFKVVKTKEFRQFALICDRQKDYDPFPPMIFDMELVDTTYQTIDGEEVTSLVPVFVRHETLKAQSGRPNKSSRIAMESLKEAIKKHGIEPDEETKERMGFYLPGDKIVHIDYWREVAYLSGIADEPKAKKQSFRRNRKEFLENEVIGTYDDFIWIRGS